MAGKMPVLKEKSLTEKTKPALHFARFSNKRISHAKQIPLFVSEAKGKDEAHSPFPSQAFSDNKGLPIHRWVPWFVRLMTSCGISTIS